MPTAERNRAKLLRRGAASSAAAVAAVLLPVNMAHASPSVPPAPGRPVVTGDLSATSGPVRAMLVIRAAPAAFGSVQGTASRSSTAQLVPTPVATTTATSATMPASEGYIGGSSVSVGGLWSGGDLQAATSFAVPLTFGGLLLVFVLVQWLIDHRDPRFVEAPARKEDDSLGFE